MFNIDWNTIKPLIQTYRLAIAMATLGLMLTGGVVYHAQEHNRNDLLKEFHGQAEEYHRTLEQGIAERLSFLQELQALYAASKSVERDEFYIYGQHFFKRFPEGIIQAWVPWVDGEQRLVFEQMAQKEWPNFLMTERSNTGKISPTVPKDIHLPLYFVEPVAGLVGFDLASNPVILQTLQQARDTGQQTASKIFADLEKNLPGSHFLVASPIYYNGLPIETQVQRREHHHGFYITLFSIEKLMTELLHSIKMDGFRLWIQEKNGLLFYTYNGTLNFDAPEKNASNQRFSKIIKILNQSWVLHIEQDRKQWEDSKVYLSHKNSILWDIIFGLLSTIFLTVWTIRWHYLTNKLLENKLYTDSIIRSMGDALLVISPRGRIISANQSACLLLGWNAESLTNLRIGHIFNEEITAQFLEICAVEQEKESAIHHISTILFNKQRVKISVLLSLSVLKDRQQKFIGIVCVAKDITELKLAEEKIKQALLESLVASMAKSEFIDNMSHEIRTPMNAIVGLTHLSIQSDPPPRLLNFLQKIDTAAHSLLSLINDILDFSEMDANRMKLELVEFYWPDLFDSLDALFREQTAKKGIELHFAFSEECEIFLLGDFQRIKQIFVYLLRNAVKFTDAGTIMVRVRCTETMPDWVQLNCSVQDTGIGILPEKCKIVFEPFVQGDGSSTRKYGGTGLGLTLCKMLVDLMDGTIGLESRPEVGSTFHFSIPVKRALAGTRKPPVERVAEVAVTEVYERQEINTTFDRAQVKSLLAELNMLLSSQNLGTEAVMNALKEQLHATPAWVLFQQLESEMNDYAFSAALHTSAKIATVLEL